MNPLATVIVISYNHKNYLEQAIRSVKDQTYSNVELIVIDDCSTDGSGEFIRELQAKISFVFIQNEKNVGLNNTITKASAIANGEFISVLAADDVIFVDKLESQVKFLLDSGRDGVYGNGYKLEGDVQSILLIDKAFFSNDKSNILSYLYQYDYNAPLLQSGLFRKKAFFDLLPSRKEYKSDDWAFIIEAYRSFDIAYINKPNFLYRMHGNNTHKNYWFTFPMRIDIASRLIPAEYRAGSLSNIMFLQAQNLLIDGHFIIATKLYMSSIIFKFSWKKIYSMSLTYLLFFKEKLF